MKIQLPDNEWLQYLQDAYRQLLSAAPLPFSKLTPSTIPEVSGVYIITARLDGKDVPYYVGRSKNLRQRLYNNHLMGPLTNARLKKYLINFGECASLAEAKEFIRAHCWARWIEEPDIRTRGAIEGYITGMLFPKYGIYEEHQRPFYAASYENDMKRDPIYPPLRMTFDEVFEIISKQPESKTPELVTTGHVSFMAEAKYTLDGRRFIALPHNNRIYENDWGFRSNHMGKSGQRIGQYAIPIDEWAKRL